MNIKRFAPIGRERVMAMRRRWIKRLLRSKGIKYSNKDIYNYGKLRKLAKIHSLI